MSDEPKNEDTAHVGTAIGYAAYQEYGTAKMKAQPFMRPALDIVQNRILNIFQKNSKVELQEYFKE